MESQCQLMRQHALHRNATRNRKISLLADIRRQQHRRRVLPSICKAVQSPEVSAEKRKGTTNSTHGQGKTGRFGLATADLNKLADSAPEDVYKSQSSIVSSAAQLAQLLDSSLTGGISESSAQMAERGSRLGQNKLPERNQVSLGFTQHMQTACQMEPQDVAPCPVMF